VTEVESFVLILVPLSAPVIRDRVEPTASPAESAMQQKALPET
jgi:hypothetical protein